MKSGLNELDPWKIMQGVQAMQNISANSAKAKDRKETKSKAEGLERAGALYAEAEKAGIDNPEEYVVNQNRINIEEENKSGIFGGALRKDKPTEFRPGTVDKAVANHFVNKINKYKAQDANDARGFYEQIRKDPKIIEQPGFGADNPVAANAAIAQARREDSENANNKNNTYKKRLAFGKMVAETKRAVTGQVDQYLADGDTKLAGKALENFINKGPNNMPHTVEAVEDGLYVLHSPEKGKKNYKYKGVESGEDVQNAERYTPEQLNTMLKNITDDAVIKATMDYAAATAKENHRTFVNPDYMYNPKTKQTVAVSRASNPDKVGYEFIITDRKTGKRTEYKDAEDLRRKGFVGIDKEKEDIALDLSAKKQKNLEGKAKAKSLSDNMKAFKIAIDQVKSSGRYEDNGDGTFSYRNPEDLAKEDMAPAGKQMLREAAALMPQLIEGFTQGDFNELVKELQPGTGGSIYDTLLSGSEPEVENPGVIYNKDGSATGRAPALTR